MTEIPDSGSVWPVSWEAAREAQLDAALRATPSQRVAWLEAAIRLAYASGALPRQDEPKDPPGRTK